MTDRQADTTAEARSATRLAMQALETWVHNEGLRALAAKFVADVFLAAGWLPPSEVEARERAAEQRGRDDAALAIASARDEERRTAVDLNQHVLTRRQTVVRAGALGRAVRIVRDQNECPCTPQEPSELCPFDGRTPAEWARIRDELQKENIDLRGERDLLRNERSEVRAILEEQEDDPEATIAEALNHIDGAGLEDTSPPRGRPCNITLTLSPPVDSVQVIGGPIRCGCEAHGGHHRACYARCAMTGCRSLR